MPTNMINMTIFKSPEYSLIGSALTQI